MGQAGAKEEIEITSAMIEAGCRALEKSGALGEGSPNKYVIDEIISCALMSGGFSVKTYSGHRLDGKNNRSYPESL